MRRTVTLLGAMLAVTLLAAGCYHGASTDPVNYDELQCDQTGCRICEGSTCYPYYCDASNQCPDGYACTEAGSCAMTTGGGGGGGAAEVTCDTTGCQVCRQGELGPVCYAYSCDSANRCPDGYACSEAGNCEPEEDPGTCPTQCCAHADCTPGMLCSGTGICITPPAPDCDDEHPCGVGLVCQDGDCVEPPPECAVDSDCDPGERCTDGDCEAIAFPPRPQDRCLFSSDCGPTGTCIDGDCHFPCAEADDSCPVTQICVVGLCLTMTGSPGECVTGADCEGEGAKCIDGTCRPGCAADTDCDLHERCNAARAICEPDPRPIYQCLASQDCADGNECVDGRCLLPCDGGTECGSRSACLEGYCAPQYRCLDAADCAGSESCVNGYCEAI